MVMDKIALTLLIIGGLNWGSVGLFQFDLVAFACGGSASMISRVVYTLVGLSAVWCVSLLFRDRDPVEGHGRPGRRRSILCKQETGSIKCPRLLFYFLHFVRFYIDLTFRMF